MMSLNTLLMVFIFSCIVSLILSVSFVIARIKIDKEKIKYDPFVKHCYDKFNEYSLTFLSYSIISVLFITIILSILKDMGY